MIWRHIAWAGDPDDVVATYEHDGYTVRKQMRSRGMVSDEVRIEIGHRWKILDKWCWYEGECNEHIARDKAQRWAARTRKSFKHISGAHVNVSGAGITLHAKHPEAAGRVAPD